MESPINIKNKRKIISNTMESPINIKKLDLLVILLYYPTYLNLQI
jgi:hypothetical protein